MIYNKVDNFDKAYTNTFNSYRSIQVEKVNPNMEFYKNNIHSIGNFDLYPTRKKVVEATNGSNKMIEEIEYTYVYSSVLSDCLIFWYASGNLGFTKENSMKVMFGINPNLSIKTLNDCMQYISGIVGIYVGKLYSPLPKYW